MLFQTKYSNLYNNREKHKVVETINVTPFVDVMLVLLVIFMISAPLMVSSVNVNLPSNDSAPVVKEDNPFTLSITKNKKIFYDKKEVKMYDLKTLLKNNLLSQNSRIFLKGDKGLNYGYIMDVMTKINQSGYNKVSLITKNDKK